MNNCGNRVRCSPSLPEQQFISSDYAPSPSPSPLLCEFIIVILISSVQLPMFTGLVRLRAFQFSYRNSVAVMFYRLHTLKHIRLTGRHKCAHAMYCLRLSFT